MAERVVREIAPVESTERPRILVADPIAPEGLAILREHAAVDERFKLSGEALSDAIGRYDALVVRSETRVTAPVIESGRRLRVIARAGVGVDNVDVEAASRQGVVVINSPTGNVAAAAEHAIALLFALARHIPEANASIRAGKWERSRFVGAEVRGKTLGIVGLGKVGVEVARRAGEGGLGMRLIASDPYASPETARALGVELAPLETLLAQSDFITLHTALTSGTRGLIGSAELAHMKPTARLINCARGGVVDESALLDALDRGVIAGAALDVFTTEPPAEESVARRLIQHPLVVATPHLGASTEEAQVNVAVDVAEQIVEVLAGGSARSAVNAPLILPDTLARLQPWMRLVEKLGRLYTQLHPGPLHQVELSVSGDIAQFDTRPLSAALIKGLLESVSEAHVNLINAPILARDWGLVVTERRTSAHAQYSSLVTLEAPGDSDERTNTLAATITWGEEQVVRVDDYLTDFEPSGHILFCHNADRPGMIGRVGTILGDAGVNIGHMDVGPLAGHSPERERVRGGDALMILSIDGEAPADAIERIRHTESIRAIVSVSL